MGCPNILTWLCSDRWSRYLKMMRILESGRSFLSLLWLQPLSQEATSCFHVWNFHFAAKSQHKINLTVNIGFTAECVNHCWLVLQCPKVFQGWRIILFESKRWCSREDIDLVQAHMQATRSCFYLWSVKYLNHLFTVRFFFLNLDPQF